MTKICHYLLAMLLLLTMVSCGFHLRGWNPQSLRSLPFRSIYVNGTSSVANLVRDQLKHDSQISLEATPQQAEAILNILNEKTQKDILTINSAGKINQYLLVYRVSAQLNIAGKPYGEEMQFRVRRTLNYTDAEVLGKNQEEQLLWNDMYNDAATQIVHRLAYVKPKPVVDASSPASEASASRAEKANASATH